jgi:hypothetical protein
MRHFLHLGQSKSLPKHGLLQVMIAQKPHHMMRGQGLMSGFGFAGVHKKDIGSFRGAGAKKTIAPLRFKM